jgi:hypothetical protein
MGMRWLLVAALALIGACVEDLPQGAGLRVLTR